MHPLRNGSQADVRPPSKPLSGVPGWFTESGDNNVPSYPGADWFNHNIAEFQNALAEMGIVFDPTKEDHLAKAFEYIKNEIDGKTIEINGAIIRNASILSRLNAIGGRLQQDGKTVVITGDSLSYNYQDYDTTFRNHAVDCFSGMKSWSFMLRDAIIKADPSFTFIEDQFITGQIDYLGEMSEVRFNAASAKQLLPFSGRVASFRMNVNDTIAPAISMSVYNDGESDSMYFLQLMHPNNLPDCMSCKVDIDGVEQISTLTNKSADTKFRGFDIRQIEITVPRDGERHELKFHTFTQASDTPDPAGQMTYNLIGVASKRTEVELTGSGGYSSSQLLAAWPDKVTQYQPDVLICIVGANDPYKGVSVETFKDNIRELNNLTKSSNEGCEILWLSTPYSGEAVVPNAIAQEYVDALRQVADELGDGFVDIVEFFKNIPTDIYRFDNIHFTKEGNQILARYIANLIGLGDQLKEIKSDYSLYKQQKTPNVAEVKPSVILLTGTVSSTNKVFKIERKSGLGNEVISAVATSPAVIQVTMKRRNNHYKSILVDKFFFGGKMFLCPIIQLTPTSKTFNFAVLNPDGTTITDGDWDTYASDFKFLIRYS
ncbi:SGNH/GDSL hydrolase family protein [Shewanella sp. M16]|uniref:SGNH/GDSL hydrolase family protein n=1 Tax=Shewanella sp. M16 TaxID=2830837 RepID=UPI001BAEF6B5|nr:SGNH/GDSL hydrolase family protein [Shewanella sp. M16]MBS0044494.1 SGNH/GDSL hydrolase family protein [Shewanella sp. M16]QYW06291.1 SGNH/GDSL hydrolase family protein [Shewanella phage vB_SspM_MuM16-2]